MDDERCNARARVFRGTSRGPRRVLLQAIGGAAAGVLSASTSRAYTSLATQPKPAKQPKKPKNCRKDG